MITEQNKDLNKLFEDMTSSKNKNTTNSSNEINGINNPLINAFSIEDIATSANNNPFVMTEKEYNKYAKYGVYPDASYSKEDLDKQRAKNQGFLEELGRSAGQMIWNEMVLGILKAPGQIYDAIATDNWRKPAYEQMDFSSPYTKFFEDAQERAKERLEIYRKNPNKAFDISDSAWWADNLVSVASTVSLMVPGLTTTKLINGVSKAINTATKLGTISNDINSVSKFLKAAAASEKLSARGAAAIYNKVANSENKFAQAVAALTNPQAYEKISKGAEIANMALVSRIGENYMEARETYKTVYDEVINQLNAFDDNARATFIKNNPNFADKSNEDIAKYIAGESANKTYKEDFAMLLMDIAQFKSVGSFLKAGANRTSTISLRAANKDAIVGVEKAAETKGLAKWFSPNRRAAFRESFAPKNILNTIETLELSEGVEEGYQGIVQASSEEVAKKYFNPNYTDRTFESYLHDPHIWEQAFWGILGGIAFQGASKGFDKLQIKLYTKFNKDLSEKDIEQLLTTESKQRLAEISNRKNLIDDFVSNQKEIEKGNNPFKRDVDGNVTAIKDGAEKAILIEQNVDDFIENITMNAIDKGNYDLLEEWVQNSDVDKAIVDAGGVIDQSINSRLISRMKDIRTQYETAYSDIVRNTVATNPFVIKLAARQVIRTNKILDEMDKAIATTKEALSHRDDYDDFAEYIDSDIASQSLLYALGHLTNYDFDARFAALKERMGKTDDTMLSSYAYEQEVKELNKEKEAFVDFIMANGFYRNAEAENLYKQGKQNTDKIIRLFKQEGLDTSYDLTKEDGSTKQVKPIEEYTARNYNERTKDLIKSIATIEFKKGLNKYNTYTTKQDFIDLYDDFESTVWFDTKNKFNEAYNQVLNYIKKAKDYDSALSDLMNNRVKDNSIQRALEILKIGYFNRLSLTNALANDIDRLKNKDNKVAEEKKIQIVDGFRMKAEEEKSVETKKQENSSKKESINKQVEDDVFEQEFEEEIEDTELNDASALAATPQEPMQEIDSSIDQFHKNDNEAQFKIAFHPEINDDGANLTIAANAAYTVLSKNNSPKYHFDNIPEENKNAEKEKIVDKVVEVLVGLYTFPRDLAVRFAPLGVERVLANADYLNVNKNSPIISFLNSFDELKSAISYNADDVNIADKFIELFTKYDTLANCLIDVNGRTAIDLKKLAQYITVFAKEYGKDNPSFGYTFALDFIATVKGFINSSYANNYLLLNKEVFNDNSQDIIDKVYNELTRKDIITRHMHFDSTSNEKIRNANFKIFEKTPNAKLKIRKDNERASISVYFTDNDGIDRELGYAATVEALDDNSRFKRSYGEGILWDVSKSSNGTISIQESIQKLVDVVSNGVDKNDENHWLYLLLLASFDKDVYTQLGTKQYNKLSDKFRDSGFWKNIIDSKSYNRPTKNASGEFTGHNLNKFLKDFANIIFYELNSENSIRKGITELSPLTIKESFQDLVNKIYQNYSNTFKIQTSNEIFEVEYNSDSLAGSTLQSDVEQGIQDVLKDAFETKQDAKNHPYVYSDGVSLFSENGIELPVPDWMMNGMSGIYLYTNGDKPIIAKFYNRNPLYNIGGKQTALYNAVRDHIQKLIFDYSNTPKDKVEQAYNELYNSFSQLFGRQQLFNGFAVSTLPSEDAFAIKVNDPISPMYNKSILTVFKYNSKLKYNKESERYTVDNENVTDLTKYYKARFRSNLGYKITLKEEEEQDAYLKHQRFSENIANAILNGGGHSENNEKKSRIETVIPGEGLYYFDYKGLTFNSDATVAKDAVTTQNTEAKDISKYITRNEDGTLTMKFGDKQFTYNSFGDWLVKNNAMTTKFNGRLNPNEIKFDNTPSSIYVDVSSIRTPVEGRTHDIASRGFAEFAKQNDGKVVNTKDVFASLGFSKEEIDTYLNPVDNISIVDDTVKIDLQNNPKDNASYHPRAKVKTYLHQGALTESKTSVLRVLIHERVHRLADENLFNKKDAAKKVKAIDECYNQFINSINNDTPQAIRDFAASFSQEYSIKDEKLRAKEFIAEVMTRDDLARYLNDITYTPKYIIQEEQKQKQKKSLLQRLFEIIMDLFGFNLQDLDKNSILGNIYDIVSDNSIVEATTDETEDVTTFKTKETVATDIIKEIEGNTELDDLDLFSSIPYTNNKVKENPITQDYKVNPAGVTVVSSMNDFVSRFPIEKQAQIEAEVRQNRIQYVCQI